MANKQKQFPHNIRTLHIKMRQAFLSSDRFDILCMMTPVKTQYSFPDLNPAPKGSPVTPHV